MSQKLENDKHPQHATDGSNIATGLGEQLSALVDDELTENEQGLLLRRLADDVSLQQQWSRYHLISDTLRGQCNDPKLCLSDSVMAQIDAECETYSAEASSASLEPAHLSQDQKRTPIRRSTRLRFLKPIAGLGIAASVATVAVLGVRGLQNDQPTAAQIAAASPVSSPSGVWASGVWGEGFQQAAEHLSVDTRPSSFEQITDQQVIRRKQPVYIYLQPASPSASQPAP